MEKIESLIAQVKIINEKHEVIKKLNGDHFNIFSILRLETREVDTHSYFIYELLNPKGSHNQEDVFLKLFLKQILKKKEYKKMGSIVYVQRETLTHENRRIDFTIETSNLLIAIEMKIEAKDQENQLFDYDEYIKTKKKNTKLYYLTLHGTEASKESLGKLTDKGYKKLSFYDDIHSWIEECIEKSSTVPILREGLVHYRNLIRKLTSQMGDKMSKEIKNIVKSSEDMKAINIIYSEYGNILARKEAKFWFELYEKLEDNEFKFKVTYLTDGEIKDNKIDYEVISEKRKKKNDYFGLRLTKKFDKNIQIECDIYVFNNQSIQMDFQIREKNKKRGLSQQETILKTIGFNKKDGDSRKFYLKEEVKFYGDGEPTFDLFDDDKFNDLVEKISKEVLETLQKISEKENDLLKDI